MMLLLENWDIKDSNNEIIQVKGTNKAALRRQRSGRDFRQDRRTADALDYHAQPEQAGGL